MTNTESKKCKTIAFSILKKNIMAKLSTFFKNKNCTLKFTKIHTKN